MNNDENEQNKFYISAEKYIFFKQNYDILSATLNT